MFNLSSTSIGLEFLSVNLTSLQENSELNIWKNVKFFGEISNNWPKGLLGTNLHKTLDFCY